MIGPFNSHSKYSEIALKRTKIKLKNPLSDFKKKTCSLKRVKKHPQFVLLYNKYIHTIRPQAFQKWLYYCCISLSSKVRAVFF